MMVRFSEGEEKDRKKCEQKRSGHEGLDFWFVVGWLL
jgi:hypothetical protein